MVEKKWGLKHRCLYCKALFYDMRQDPPVCPACDREHDVKFALKLKPQADARFEKGEEEDIETDDEASVLEEEMDSDSDVNSVSNVIPKKDEDDSA